MFFGASSLALVGCDGSATSASTPSSVDTPVAEQEVLEFLTEDEKFVAKAKTTEGSYVSSSFDYSSLNTTALNIDLSNTHGEALPFTRLTIYWIDVDALATTPSEWSETYREHAQLLSAGMTNSDGEFKRVLDIPKVRTGHPLLLLEVNADGFANKLLVPITAERTYIALNSSL